MEKNSKEEILEELDEQEEKREECKECKSKKGSMGLVTILMIALIAVSAICGWIVGTSNLVTKYDQKINEVSKTTQKEVEEEKDEPIEVEEPKVKENDEVEKVEETTAQKDCITKNVQRCSGTYYVNGDSRQGAVILKEDGTFKAENKEQFGIFTINENTITFIEMKHTTGPRDEDPIYYNPKSYLISDDCSKIRLTESGNHTSASLEKAN